MIHGNLELYKQFIDEKEETTFKRYIKNFLNEFYVQKKDSVEPLLLSFKDMLGFFPLEFNIIENLEMNYDDIITQFNNSVLDWCDHKRKLFFEVPDKLISEENYFNLTSDYVNRLIKIKATVDIINQYEDIPQNHKVSCNSCGHVMIEKRFEYKKCSKCDSQQLIKQPNDFISRRHIDFSDPNQTEGSCVIEGYVDVYSKKDRIIFPDNLIGQDLELLGLLRIEKLRFGKFKRKFEIIGLKLDKYRGLKPEKIEKIINIIRKDDNAFVNIAFSMNHDIKGMDFLKLILFATAVGLAYPDKQFGFIHVGINVIIIGSPAVGKSNLMDNLMKYFYKARKSTAKSLSRAGALGGVDVTKEKRTISAGEISRCNDRVLFIDECKHLSDDVKAGLLTCMSDGWHTLKYAGINFKFKYNTNIVLIGNPKTGELLPNTPLKDQIDFDPELISRCVITTMPTAYYQEKDGQINKDRLQEIFEIRRINEDDRNKAKDRKYSDKFLLDYATAVKTFPNPIIKKEQEIMIEKYIESFADSHNISGTFHGSENHQKGKLDLRMINALKIISKIIARAEFSNTVKTKHIELTIKIYDNTMIKFRQLFNMDIPEVIEERLITTSQKIYPKTNQAKIDFVYDLIPRGNKIEWGELLSKCVEFGISERELDKILHTMLHKTGDIMMPDRSAYSKI